MTALIIDDEPLARILIREYLQDHPSINVVQECNDGFEGLKAITQHQPDLIFLDIQMPKITGFEMLELIEKPPAVIFTTAHDEYAIKAFDSHAIDYLLKPFSKERFDTAIQKLINNSQRSIPASALEGPIMPQQNERIVVKHSGKILIIPVAEVEYLEAADDYVKVYSKGSSWLKNKTMGYFEKALNPSMFVRTHRSYIINVQQINRIDPYEKDSHLVLLKSGAKVPVSKSGYAKLKSLLGL